MEITQHDHEPASESPKEYFLRKLDKRGVPVFLPGHFADSLLEKGAPPGTLEAIADNFTYIDKERFVRGLDTMADTMHTIVGENEYVVGMEDIDFTRHSNYWIYNQLLQRGISAARSVLHTRGRKKDSQPIPRSTKILLPDDCSLSGMQMGIMVGILRPDLYKQYAALMNGKKRQEQSEHPALDDQMHALLLVCSEEAASELRYYGTHAHVVEPLLRSTANIFNEEQLEFLLKLSRSAAYDSGPRDPFTDTDGKGAYLYSSWYQIPDAMPHVLTGLTGIPRLIDKPPRKPYGY